MSGFGIASSEIARRVDEQEYHIATGGYFTGRFKVRPLMRKSAKGRRNCDNQNCEEQDNSCFEGFVAFGYSDGATTLHREFRKGRAGGVLGDVDISFT